GRAGRVVHGGGGALLMSPPQVVPVCAGEHGRQHGDAAAADPDLAAAQLAGDDDAPPAGGVRALGVLDPAAAGTPQVPVVHHRVVGDQQFEHGVVDWDLRRTGR